ncbi:MAG: Holliday junction branch migration DNA helicase RuvB, partial [Rhodospirillaceae bacterium]|nr:Holliday junction branch migration DNA helicase RuvB [Rhodospirillaceae bacterium]
GPVGVETVAAALSEHRDALEDVIEPFLMQQGFVQRTPRGRMITSASYEHLGLNAPKDRKDQVDLFVGDEADG